LTDVNTIQSSAINTANDNITDVTNTVSGHTTSISTINTNITNLQSADGIHDSAISAIETDITNIQSDISALESYNTSNDTAITTIQGDITAIEGDITTIQGNITSLESSKQNVIDSSHKLSSGNVDYSSSPLRFVDISGNLQAQLTSLSGSITTLTTLQNGDISNFEAIDANFTDVNTAIGLKQDIIGTSNRLNANLVGTGEVSNTKFNYLKNVTSDIQSQINGLGGGGGGSGYASISYDAGTTTTTITDKTVLGTLEFGDASQQTTAYTSAKNTDLSNTKAKATAISYNSGTTTTTIANTLVANDLESTVIDTINSTLTTLDSAKQNVLNATTNKLDASYLNAGSGTMSNTKLQHLSSIASDLATSLNAINSAITALQSFDTSQTTLNTGYASDISALYSGKQDLLASGNKLNPAFINAGSGTLSSTKMQYLSSIGGDITDALSGKQDVITDGSLTIARTSGLQTALDGKQATITDASLTIARTNGLQTALDEKLNTLRSFNTVSAGSTQYDVVASDLNKTLIISASGSGSRVVKLPSESTYSGYWIRVVNSSSTSGNTLNFQNSAGTQIAGTASNTALAGSVTEFFSNGTLWLRS
jgi:hypothetical protein